MQLADRVKSGWIVLRATGVLVLLLLVPFMVTTNKDISLAITATMYATVAFGLQFLFVNTGRLSAAHGALWGLGAYTAALLDHGFWAGMLLAIPVCVIAAIIVGTPSLRLSGHYFLIITFAFAQFMVLVANNWIEVTGGRDGIIIRESPHFLGVDFSNKDNMYYLALTFMIVSLVTVWLLSRSQLGMRLRAVRDNPDLAASIGLNVWVLRLSAFAWSGVMAGMGGAIYTYYIHVVEPNFFGHGATLDLILIPILGGGQSLVGPILGSYAFVFLPEFLGFSPNLARSAFGAVLIVLIIGFPRGVAGIFDIIAGAWQRVSDFVTKRFGRSRKSVSIPAREE